MNYIDDILKSAGEEHATLKNVDESNVNRWGDADESVSESEISGVFEVLSGETQEVAEGDFESGDIRAYIPARYEDDISESDILVYQGKEYEVDEVMKMEVGHESHLEVHAERV